MVAYERHTNGTRANITVWTLGLGLGDVLTALATAGGAPNRLSKSNLTERHDSHDCPSPRRYRQGADGGGQNVLSVLSGKGSLL